MSRLSIAGAALLLAASLLPAAADEILVLYDNTSAHPRAGADWGFAALVTVRGQKVLFDSGTKPDLLLANMKAMAVNPADIPHMVLSHEHRDHTGGISRLQSLNPSMRVLRPGVKAPVQIVPGVFSTGVVEGNPPEQALAIETATGLVVLTGCSHPGIVKMVETAERQRGVKSVRLLVGGFHMLQQSEAEASGHIARLKALGVQSVYPTHCTGDLPVRLFQKAFGARFSAAGAGRHITLD